MFNNAQFVELAQTIAPIFLFDPTERFFPIAGEEWVTQAATEPWSAPETHERGSAVLRVALAQTTFSDHDVVAGRHDPAGAELTLTAVAPTGIGQPFSFTPGREDLFIDFAGWNDAATTADAAAPRFSNGAIDYLDLTFRGLGNAMNPSLPIDEATDAPNFSVPRLTSPTIYVECEWAGQYPRSDAARVALHGGIADFPPAIGGDAPPADAILHELDDYLILTYYALYPAMEPSAAATAPGGVRQREGQWEAISVFLKGRTSDARDSGGRPDFVFEIVPNNPTVAGAPAAGQPPVLVGITPRFTAYSRGYEVGDDVTSPLAAEVRPLFATTAANLNVTIFDGHPLAYVTAGSHKNLFAAAALVTTGDSQPNTTLNPLGGAIMGAAGTAAGVCLGLAPPPLTPACIICLIIAAIAFLIGLILFLLSFLFRSDPPVTEAPNPGSTDVARDGGPAALPPAQAQPTRPGVPPTGNALAMNLRFINRFTFDPAAPVTTYPLPAPNVVELPTWFDFIGRYGVRIVNRSTNTWDSGTRRTDAFGRSRGYWNTYRLVQFLSDPARATDGITA